MTDPESSDSWSSSSDYPSGGELDEAEIRRVCNEMIELEITKSKLQKQREYSVKNREKIRERQKAYYHNNREKYIASKRAQAKIKMECICGAVVSKMNTKKHEMSNKHNKFMAAFEKIYGPLEETGVDVWRRLDPPQAD